MSVFERQNMPSLPNEARWKARGNGFRQAVQNVSLSLVHDLIECHTLQSCSNTSCDEVSKGQWRDPSSYVL